MKQSEQMFGVSLLIVSSSLFFVVVVVVVVSQRGWGWF
jgi:hypothetical protein